MRDKTESRPENADRRETVSFPFDRMAVERFRQAFPRARWNDELKAWTVPGKTARRRIDRWLAHEMTRQDPYAGEKGKDAYQFEPIVSRYLEVGDCGLCVRTPFSRVIIDEMRQIPHAAWDRDRRVWQVPFASYGDLLQRWEIIEAAARHSEPEERQKRADARKGTEEERRARRLAAERKRRRLPLMCDDCPPLERPLSTGFYGIVVLTDITGELVEHDVISEFYPDAGGDRIWGSWRPPTLQELIHTWPAKAEPGEYERRRGWWQPTIEELRDARRRVRAQERRTASRSIMHSR